MKKVILGAVSVMASTIPAAFMADAPTKTQLVMGGLTAFFLLAGKHLLSTGLEDMFDASASRTPHMPSPSIAPGRPGGVI